MRASRESGGGPTIRAPGGDLQPVQDLEPPDAALLEAAFAKQKIDLARLAGLPPTDRYDLDRSAPFSPGPQLTLEQALKEASQGRADLKAADAQVRAAELSVSAARAERLPRVTLRASSKAMPSPP